MYISICTVQIYVLYVFRSTSLLASHPDVVTPPIIGPALLINEQLLTWELEREGERHQEERIETRVLFETGVKELSKRNITLTNTGTVVIRYTWKVTVYTCIIIVHLHTQYIRQYCT